MKPYKHLFILLSFLLINNPLSAQNDANAWQLTGELSYHVRNNNDKTAIKLIDSLFLNYPDCKYESAYTSAIKCLRRNNQPTKAMLIFQLGKERKILKIGDENLKIKYPIIRDTLVKYYIEDQNLKNTKQKIRQKINDMGLAHLFDEAKEEPYHIYTQRHEIGLRKIFNRIGFPSPNDVGYFAASKIYLLILHQGDDMMIEFEPVFKEQAPRMYAYLKDKLMVFSGKPQIYGTQIATNNSKPVFYKIDNPKEVDIRRMSIGLEPLKYYALSAGIDWEVEKYKYE